MSRYWYHVVVHFSLHVKVKSESRHRITFSFTYGHPINETGLICEKVSSIMFSIYCTQICSCDDVTQAKLYIGSSTSAPYVAQPTVIKNGTKERLLFQLEHWYGPSLGEG